MRVIGVRRGGFKMLKKKQIQEMLETKEWWMERWISAGCWEVAGQSKREIEILKTILELDDDANCEGDEQ